MAKIPMGDFGQAVPQTRQTATPSITPLAPGRAVDDGGIFAAQQRAGASMATMGEQGLQEIEHARKQEAAKQAARAEQVQQLTAHASIQTGLADLNDELTAGLSSGAIKKDDARKAWTERSGKVVADKVAGLPADLAPLVTAQMQGLTGQLNNRLEDTIRKRDQQEADAGLMTYREQMERFAATDMPSAVKQYEQTARTAGPAAGWTPEKVEKEVQTFREAVNYTRAYELVSNSRNNRGALDVAEQAIGNMEGLDPQKKAVLMDRTAAYKFSLDQRAEMLAARAARQQEAALKKAEATYQTFQSVSDKGLALDPAYIDTVIKQTAGTPYQAGVVQLARQSQEAGGLASMPVPAQRAALDAITVQIAKEGNSPALARRREQIEKVLNGSSADIKRDPLRAYIERSADVVEFKPLDTSSLPAITKSLTERLPIAERARLWSGGPVSPLTGEEIEPVRRILETLGPKERSAAIATLATAMGPQAASGLAHQLNDKDKALGLAFGAAGSQTTAGRYTSELILKGAAAEKDGTSTKNKNTAEVKVNQWKSFMTTELENVYPSQKMTTDVRDAALLIAHGIAAENGGELSQRDMRRAVTLAVGGELVEHNGRKVPLPAGMDSDALEKRLRSISPAEIALQAAPLPERTPGMLAPGNIDLKNRPPVKNADGSVSTVRSLGVNVDGKEVLIPTVVGGKVVSDDAAIAEYRNTGKHLGVFESPAASTAYAESLHKQQENAQFVRAAGVPVPVDQFVKGLPGAELSYAGAGKFNVLVNGRPVMSADGKRVITIKAQ